MSNPAGTVRGAGPLQRRGTAVSVAGLCAVSPSDAAAAYLRAPGTARCLLICWRGSADRDGHAQAALGESVRNEDRAGLAGLVPGRVMLDRELEDGKSLIVVRGLCRARIRAEKLCKTPYRQVELDLKLDEYPDSPEIARANRRAELLEGLVSVSPEAEANRETTESALRELPLGVLADLIASSAEATDRDHDVAAA